MNPFGPSILGASHVANGPELEALFTPDEAPAMADPNGYESALTRYPASGWQSSTPTSSYIVTVKSGASQAVLPGNITDFTILENRGSAAAMRGFNLNSAGRSFSVAGAGIDAVVRVNLSGSAQVTTFTPLADAPASTTTTDNASDPAEHEDNVSVNLDDSDLDALNVDPDGELVGAVPYDPDAPVEEVGLSPVGKLLIGAGVLLGGYFAFRKFSKGRRRRRA